MAIAGLNTPLTDPLTGQSVSYDLPGQNEPAPVAGPQIVKGTKSILGSTTLGNAKLGTLKQAATSGGGAATMTTSQVRAMQQFLVNKGFNINVDGILGPLTKSAAASFRANHNSATQWNKSNGTGVHPATKAALPVTTKAAAKTNPVAAATGTTPTEDPTDAAYNALLSALLVNGGEVGSMINPIAEGTAAAAPYTGAATADQNAITQAGAQNKQDLADISNWYGLNPKASSYQLSVLGKLGQAQSADKSEGTAATNNIAQLAQSLAGSVGGNANGGSDMVASTGANDAGTMAAISQANQNYENNMNPLLMAEARGQMSQTAATNAQNLLSLKSQLATDQGNATAAEANAAEQALEQNNSTAQQRFANQGNLLSMLSSLMAADPNANALDDAKIQAQIKQIEQQGASASALAALRAAQTKNLTNGKSANGTTKTSPKVNLASLDGQVSGLVGQYGVKAIPADTAHITQLVYQIGSVLQASGVPKGSANYQRLARSMYAGFTDPSGNPLPPYQPGWWSPNS